jgi:hypothetical protein
MRVVDYEAEAWHREEVHSGRQSRSRILGNEAEDGYPKVLKFE